MRRASFQNKTKSGCTKHSHKQPHDSVMGSVTGPHRVPGFLGNVQLSEAGQGTVNWRCDLHKSAGAPGEPAVTKGSDLGDS